MLNFTFQPADDPINSSTAHIESMSDIPDAPSPMEDSDTASSSHEQMEESTGPVGGGQDPITGEDEINPYLTEPVFQKDETKMDTYEQSLRRIIRDPAALRFVKTPYIGELFPLSNNTRAILLNNDKLRKYIESDEMFRREIFFPGHDFWGNISGYHFEMMRQKAWSYTEARSEDLDGIQRSGRYGRSGYGQKDNERMKRRVRVEKSNDEHPHIRDVKKGGMLNSNAACLLYVISLDAYVKNTQGIHIHVHVYPCEFSNHI